MRNIVQRHKYAGVCVGHGIPRNRGSGLLIYLGVGKDDDESDAKFVAEKIANLRIFEDANDRMNLSVKETRGQVLVVSNFTLFGDCRKGRRPGFDLAAEPAKAEKLYEKGAELISDGGVKVQKGVFAAYMDVTASNDGLINFLIDSKKQF